MPKPNLTVVQLRGSTLRDIPAKLRELANAIDEGKYGEVTCLGVALFGDRFEIFGFGDGIDSNGCALSVASMFRAGALRFEMEIESHGRDESSAGQSA